MDEIKKLFNALNSADQTTLLCELIKENNNFLAIEDILEVLVDIMGYEEVEEIAKNVSADFAY